MDMAKLPGADVCPVGSLKADDGKIYSVAQIAATELNEKEKAHILFYQKLAYELIHNALPEVAGPVPITSATAASGTSRSTAIPEASQKEFEARKKLHGAVVEFKESLAGALFDQAGPYYQDYEVRNESIDIWNAGRQHFKIDIYDANLITPEIWNKFLGDKQVSDKALQSYAAHFKTSYSVIAAYCNNLVAEKIKQFCLTLPFTSKLEDVQALHLKYFNVENAQKFLTDSTFQTTVKAIQTIHPIARKPTPCGQCGVGGIFAFEFLTGNKVAHYPISKS